MSDRPGSTHDLVKSDTPNDRFSWLMVTTSAGTLLIDQAGGNTTTITLALVGVWIPVGNATNVRVASTAAGIIAA